MKQGENCISARELHEGLKIKSKFKTILVFYDNDLAGIQGMCRIKKIHPELKFAFIPKKYEAKDISDFYKKYGKQKTKELIDKAIEYYGKQES